MTRAIVNTGERLLSGGGVAAAQVPVSEASFPFSPGLLTSVFRPMGRVRPELGLETRAAPGRYGLDKKFRNLDPGSGFLYAGSQEVQ